MIALLFGALALGACATQPEIRGAELDALAEELIQYAADNTDLEPLPPPRIEFVGDVSVVVLREISKNYSGNHSASGGYSLRDGTIYLPTSWKPDDLQRAELLHELERDHLNWSRFGIPKSRE